MNRTRLGRFVFVFQWFAAFLLPAFVVVGRMLVGAEMGWMFVFGLFYGVFIVAAMLLPPLITLADRGVRGIKCARRNYSITSLVLWVAIVLVGLTLPDQGDGPPLRPAITVWTGDLISIDAAGAICGVVLVSVVVAYVILLVLAIKDALRWGALRES